MSEKPQGQQGPKSESADAPLGMMTPKHKRWREFCERLEGPEGCNFHEKIPGNRDSLTWDCKGGRDKSHAIAILTAMGATVGEIVASCEYFSAHGGYCDCEILFNVDLQPLKARTRSERLLHWEMVRANRSQV